MAKSTKHIGSSLDDMLLETGDLSEVSVEAIKRVITWEIIEVMKKERISKSKMA